MRLTFLIPALPLAGAAFLLLWGRRLRGEAAGWLAASLVGLSFVVSLVILGRLLGQPAYHRHSIAHLFDWIDVGNFRVAFDVRADPLSMVMALTVTGVGALIHIYAIAYMRGDPRFSRFFAYMNLFVFFMLVLVLANNFLVLYLGWEGVGLCSYLLIGFWFDRPAAANAAKKAFVTTRIGDSAFLIGIIYIWVRLGRLDFDQVFHRAHFLGNGPATVIALLLFAGAVGKSAQIPLHVWLPDAMEGPTPVSALIHAATMVTAGVYLVVRAHPIFEASSSALTVVAVVGTVTAIYAGLSAIGQDDIKRMLAYSTISQLGFMFFGAGMRAYGAAMFLLVTHAFFKACLFLGAGSVMHALPNDEVDLMKMGGLRKPMPITAITWTVSAAAMAGIPPLSGFFSKDQVISSASLAGRPGFWIAALAGALLTAVYMGRGTFLAFFGEPRYEGHPHDPPPPMRLVLLALGALAAVGGVFGLSASNGLLVRFLKPVIGPVGERVAGPSEAVLTLISVVVALLGVGLAAFVYLSRRFDWQAFRARFSRQRQSLAHGFYVNDVYGGAIVSPAKAGSAFLAYVVDDRVIDGSVNGIGGAFRQLARAGRLLQTGLVRRYALAFAAGAVGLLIFVAVRS